MQVWNVLHTARWKCRTQKNLPFGHHYANCGAMSLQLRHVSIIGTKPVKQQYLPHMSLQCGELWPTSGWDLFASLGHPRKFQRVLRLGSVTARHSSSGHQPNFAALNGGRHLYSAGWPSRWVLAHILIDLVSVEQRERWGFSFLVCLDRLLVSVSSSLVRNVTSSAESGSVSC